MDCIRQLGELKREVRERWDGTAVLAVSIDSVAETEALIEELAADGPGAALPDRTALADPGHRVIDRYGLREPEGEGWARPAAFIVDRQGVVRWKRIEPTDASRPSNETVLDALAGMRGGPVGRAGRPDAGGS